GDGALVARDGGFDVDLRRIAQAGLRRVDDARQKGDAGGGVFEVLLFGQRGLRQQQIDAVGQVLVVQQRVFLERQPVLLPWRQAVLQQPQIRFEAVRQDLVIDLGGARQLFVIDLLRQLGERFLVALDPAGPRPGGQVIEEVVVIVIAQAGGGQGVFGELFRQIRLEEGGELVLLALVGRRGEQGQE